MKTIKFLKTAMLAILISCSLTATSSSITTIPTESPLAAKSTDPKVEQLISRLNEIKSVDKTTMTSAEKKVMRKEVRVIKKELKQLNQGVYLSVGAIIIIILLLILIL